MHPLSDVESRFAAGTSLRAGDLVLDVVASRSHQGRVLVHFDGVDDRSSAERLRGLELEAPPADGDTGDSFLVSELVGVDVVDDEGTPLGRVVASIELPAAAEYELLEVERPDGSTWLLPAVGDFVVAEERDDGAIVLVLTAPPEGLLEP